MELRAWMMGAGAATAVGAVGAVSLTDTSEPPMQSLAPMKVEMASPPPVAAAPAIRDFDTEFCLPDLGPGASGCMSRAQLLKMDDHPVDRVTPSGEPRRRKLTMVHPSDFAVPEREVLTCTDFGELKSEGWGGMTTADQADESYFVRYCGLRSIARLASPARTSKFDPAGLSKRELDTIPAKDWPTLAEEGGTPDEPVLRQSPDEPRAWLADSSTLTMRIHDVALADFDEDGEAERLIFLAGRARGGTSGFASYALLEHMGGDMIRIRRVQLD
ncbi:hypothetical protein [Parvularcula sp. LCG005]|uniref:hypothetical protein n=1 Tax=Parvularcula sp. LCG005 TaxID=3078805 RepID=UPI00294254E1|nr:hypothetical protein [Parvularcula sp. LCG005]WOI54107.1 hypothetical protein RUI03_03680 [Parvularcula sp. LCG005]